jgi:ComEC/Rec2-related protein
MNSIPRAYFFAFPLALGITLSHFSKINPVYLWAVVTVCFGVLACAGIFLRKLILFIATALLCTGFCLDMHARNHSNIQFAWLDRVDAVAGWASEIKEKNFYRQITLSNAGISIRGHTWALSGPVVVFLPGYAEVDESDFLLCQKISILEPNRLPAYPLLLRAEYWSTSRTAGFFPHLRNRILSAGDRVIEKHFRYSPQSAGLLKMMILGEKQESAALKDVFIKTGTYHILIVSGLHLAYLISLIGIVLFPLRHFWQSRLRLFNTISLVVVFFYAFIAGFGTPIARASFMFGLYCLAELIERRITGGEALAYAAFLILLVSPEQIFNLGFQLSFGATGGILIFTKYLPRWNRFPLWVESAIKANLGAEIFTFPILLGNLGIFYPIGLAANFFLVPLGGAIVWLGFLFLLTGPFRHLLYYLLDLLLKGFWLVTKFFASVSIPISFQPDFRALLFVCGIVVLLLFPRKKLALFRSIATIFMVLLIVYPAGNLDNNHDEPSGQKLNPNTVAFLPCRDMCFMFHYKGHMYLIVGGRETRETWESALKFLVSSNKPVTLVFTHPGHDILEPIDSPLIEMTEEVIDNSEILKHPAFGYRQIYALSNHGIRQKFWKISTPIGPLLPAYYDGKRMAFIYETGNTRILLASDLNAKILKQIPGTFDIVYSTRLFGSKKLAELLDERGAKTCITSKELGRKCNLPVSMFRVRKKPVAVELKKKEFSIAEINL